MLEMGVFIKLYGILGVVFIYLYINWTTWPFGARLQLTMGQSGKSPSIPLNKAVYVIPFPMVIPFYIQLQFNYIPVELPDCPIVITATTFLV